MLTGPEVGVIVGVTYIVEVGDISGPGADATLVLQPAMLIMQAARNTQNAANNIFFI
jgi:hypothetical protein